MPKSHLLREALCSPRLWWGRVLGPRAPGLPWARSHVLRWHSLFPGSPRPPGAAAGKGLPSLPPPPAGGVSALILGPHREAVLGNILRGSQGERRSPAPPHPSAAPQPPTLLEDLQGDGAVLDGHDHAAVVQVEDVVFLLEHLRGERTAPEKGRGCPGSGSLAGRRAIHTQAGGAGRGQLPPPELIWGLPVAPGHPHVWPHHADSAHMGWTVMEDSP